MTSSVLAAPRLSAERTVASAPLLYAAGGAFWMATRLLVLVHQGAWPWMNAFVVAAARGIVVGDWNEAVRPQLPAVVGVPLVLAGASEQQMVAALYLLASLVQYAAFVVFVRAVWPERTGEQAVALLVFLLIPFNHSIHHYRDMPVVLASAAIFLLSADFVRRKARTGVRHFIGVAAIMLLGIWSRIEMLTFVGVLAVGALIVFRRAAARTAATYVAAAALVTASLLVVYRVEDVDLSQAWFYTAHTFLDSTPDSWLTPECQATPTENCREADGLSYFGPADLHAGVVALALNHPLTTIVKSARSAWDNAWVLVGPNLSTFPGVVPFVVLAALLVRPVRELYVGVPRAAWVVAAAIAAESVLPPLTWAPPHPQYHVALVLPVMLALVPALIGLARMPRGRLLAGAFVAANAGLSALRYTRYPGY
jgi:hypothetical protein